ncbi:MAG: hypothetical protein NZ611_00785 [Bacteroidia bacterium]|nr:hypothetical protein [Bacteroidia bacterium]
MSESEIPSAAASSLAKPTTDTPRFRASIQSGGRVVCHKYPSMGCWLR